MGVVASSLASREAALGNSIEFGLEPRRVPPRHGVGGKYGDREQTGDEHVQGYAFHACSAISFGKALIRSLPQMEDAIDGRHVRDGPV